MYYDRTLTGSFAKLIEENNPLRWLFDFVKSSPDLDLSIGKAKQHEWISVYRGLTRILSISPIKKPIEISISGADRYKSICPELFGRKSVDSVFKNELETLLEAIRTDRSFARYYDNKKEGYYQNVLSRRYGICGRPDDDFVIVDKEVVIGYEDMAEKQNEFQPIQMEYKRLQSIISSIDPELYGEHIEKKSIGNELDFLALTQTGDLWLIEYKHGTNTSGIYLSPLQIGLYWELFSRIHLTDQVFGLLGQKQRIGLINSNWPVPKTINRIIPVLIISEYNEKSTAKVKFGEILSILRKEKGESFLQSMRTLNFTNSGLHPWC